MEIIYMNDHECTNIYDNNLMFLTKVPLKGKSHFLIVKCQLLILKCQFLIVKPCLSINFFILSHPNHLRGAGGLGGVVETNGWLS